MNKFNKTASISFFFEILANVLIFWAAMHYDWVAYTCLALYSWMLFGMIWIVAVEKHTFDDLWMLSDTRNVTVVSAMKQFYLYCIAALYWPVARKTVLELDRRVHDKYSECIA